MTNKTLIRFFLLIPLVFLTAFTKQDPIIVKNVEVNVIKTAGILRYDFILQKTKELKLESRRAEESPGHEWYRYCDYLNYAVRPNNALAKLMELEQNTKYVKMKLRGGGNPDNFYTNEEITHSFEYDIKDGVDFEEVRRMALDSTLLVLMGNKVIAEIPLVQK